MSDTSMSDTGASAGDVGATSAPAEAAPGSANYTPLDMPDGQQLFERSYVEKLRNESASYRTQLREMEQRANQYNVLNDYDDEDRQVWLDLAQSWTQDPYQAAEQMRMISERVLGSIDDGTASEEFYDDMDDFEEANGGEQLTPEQVQYIVQAEMQRQQAAQEMESMIGDIYGEIQAGGIDPNSMDGYMVLWRASNETNGDVAAALKAHADYKQQIVDGYVRGKASGGYSVPPPNGISGVQRQEIGGIDDAFKAARGFLAGRNDIG